MNENCLDGMDCPKCKSLGDFTINATVDVSVSDEGTDDDVENFEWDLDSGCGCQACGFLGTVRDFTIAERDKVAEQPTEPVMVDQEVAAEIRSLLMKISNREPLSEHEVDSAEQFRQLLDSRT